MGQITVVTIPSLILSATDRLQSANAGSGMSPASANVILLGENAGQNITSSRLILLGKGAGKSLTFDDVVVIGENSLDAMGGVTPPTYVQKSVVIGNNNLRDWQFRTAGAFAGSMIVIGNDIATASRANSMSVLIGRGIMQGYVGGVANAPRGGNVVIGMDAAATVGVDNNTAFSANTVIGTNAFTLYTAGVAGFNGNTVIGNGAGPTGNTSTFDNNVAIGPTAGNSTSASNVQSNILISCAVQGNPATILQDNNVGIGATRIGGRSNVLIGYGLVSPLGPATSPDGNIIIGAAPSGTQAFNTNTHNMVLIGRELTSTTLNYASTCQAYDFFIGNGIINKMLLFGNQDTGCLTLGNDVGNRNVGAGAVNCFKLVNGKRVTAGGPGSLNGAYFYSDDGTTFAAGDMRCVTPGNQDWNLTPQPTTVAALPATAPVGQRRVVTNAAGPTFGAIVAGGGAVVQSVMWNGTNWVCM